MHKRREIEANHSSEYLIQLKPRQILLAEQQKKNSAADSLMAKKEPKSPAQLKPERKSILLYSCALCLQNYGFSKTLKRFLSEAQIKDDEWEARALNLEDIFSKYLETWNSAVGEDIKRKKKKSDHDATSITLENSEKTFEEMQPQDKVGESNKKTNKERKKRADNIIDSDQNLIASKHDTDSTVCEMPVDSSTGKHKEKKKKKRKSTSESLEGDEKQLETMPDVTEVKSKDLNGNKVDSATTVEPKDKTKKQKLKKDSLPVDGEDCGRGKKSKVIEVVGETQIPEDKAKAKEKKKKKEAAVELFGSDEGVLDRKYLMDKKYGKKLMERAEGAANEHEKSSKKRKKLAYEDEKHPVEEVAVEDTKRRKTGGQKEAKVVEQQAIAAPEENAQVGQVDPQSLKGDLNKNGIEKSSQTKSTRQQRNSSAEPKQVPFQRVKVDEVNFVDERLQDNSYWAKDGAENGYGAKAQEVLGQVRGRDFRHEKTKKKRGSYRGGVIDVQSHSIKFNYSDEE